MKLFEVSRLLRHQEFVKIENPTVQDWVERYMGYSPEEYKVVNGRININGDLDLQLEQIGREEIPLPLGKIKGDFSLTEQFLQSLKNGPTEVTGDFDINNTSVTSLELGPKKVGGNYDIHKCRQLTSLKGMPRGKINGLIDARSCRKLISLDGITPKFGGANFTDTGITSLVGVADHIKETTDMLAFDWEKITEGGVGLLLIEGHPRFAGVKSFSKAHEPFNIINRYRNHPEDIYDCQAELIDKGYEEFAKL